MDQRWIKSHAAEQMSSWCRAEIRSGQSNSIDNNNLQIPFSRTSQNIVGEGMSLDFGTYHPVHETLGSAPKSKGRVDHCLIAWLSKWEQ